MKKRLHIFVYGRVQLVMFRDYTQRKAKGLDLVGTVQNKKDGSVEIFIEGEKEPLDIFITKLRKGPVLARVDRVTITEQPVAQNEKGFSIIF